MLEASLTSATAFCAAIAFIVALIASAGFDDGGRLPLTVEDVTSELALVDARIDTLSTSIDNGDIEGVLSPAGATVRMLVDRRTELIKQLNSLRSGD